MCRAAAVAAARAVLEGSVRRLDLLVDESDGVVLGDLSIPAVAPAAVNGTNGASVWDACRSLVRTLVQPAPSAVVRTHRLRVEADGVLLSDLDRQVETVTVRTGGGRAEVMVRASSAADPLTAKALTVTVSGPDFRYRADTQVTGPVRTRTWTLRPGAWGLTLPA